MTPEKQNFNCTVIELFEAQVKKHAESIALKDKNIEYTYAALNAKANQFARILKLKSVKEGDFVAILLEPSVEFFICILAIIKLGAVYVPLDTLAPQQRLHEIIQDAKPKVVITHEEYQRNLLGVEANSYLIRHLHLESLSQSSKNSKTTVSPTSPVYMIYTSGSTGKPKGVAIAHRSLVNLALIDNIIQIKEGEKTGQFCNLAFDGSVFETWVALLNGASLHIIPNEARKNHNQLKKVIKEFQIRYLLIPTGYFHQLIKSYPETLDYLHTISFGGEQVNAHLLKNFIEYRKKSDIPTTLVNVYGPTEATVFSCCNTIHRDKDYTEEQLASIGFKTANTKTYILDEHHHRTNEGELWVSGVHLAINYHNSPEQTEEKFIKNPFSRDVLFSRMYKTGDRVRQLPTGELLYLGRVDDQVKIGGFRIHLSEVEQELMNHDAVSLASVTVEIGGGAHKFLTAYIVFNSKDTPIHADEIRHFLAQKLPPYMLPAKYVMVDKLPLTAIGKIDRTKLDKIAHTDLSFHMDTSSANPIEETIKNIWKHLLNRSSIEPNKNLFDLGANSLLITDACSQINKALQCDLQIVDILTHPTIHKLSRFLEGDLDTQLIRKVKKYTSQDIAIIGMSCRFPKARNVDEFWHNLCQGTHCLTRFDEDALPYSLLANKEFVPVKGILEDSAQFDAHFFGFNPVDAKITDPQHRIFLECAWEALEHAAIAPSKMKSKVISLFSGMTDSTYLKENLLKSQWFCNEFDSVHQRIATSMGMLSTQVSYRLNFKGRSVNVNTACSTGLVTVDHACQDLILGQSDIALAGASSIAVPEVQGYFYQNGSIVSPDGYCRPFSSQANGTVFSNGVGVVVLKRLEDAIKDKNTIYAVIKGRGINNDGIDKLGFTAPSISGQISCIREALVQAQIKAEEIGFLEAHGTATALGDVIEIKALTSVYREQTDQTQFCALGSVKANIGHTDATAGIAGIIKTALSLYHKKIPPLIHYKKPNPDLSLSESPFFVNTKLLDWNSSSKRYAGVSAFGIGGTNSHIILSEYQPQEEECSVAPLNEELILLSAKTEKALEQSRSNLKHYLKSSMNSSLGDIAFTLHTGREDFQWRQFVVGKTIEEACSELKRKKHLFFDEEIHHSVVFMFSGQGMQYAQMAMELFETIPLFAQYLTLGAQFAQAYLHCDLLSMIRDKNSNKLKETQYAQPALFIVEYALAKVLMECGVIPEVLIGHSIGEYVAACIAEVFSFEDAIALVCERGLLMSKAPTGAMLSLETTKETLINNYLNIADVDIALHNATNQFVLAGSDTEISKLEEYLINDKKPSQRLKVSHAFHSRFMESIEKPFKEMFTNIKCQAPKIPIISNVTSDWLSATEATSPDYWYQHLRHTVQFSDSIHRILQDKHPLFVEVGPGHSLCGFVKELSANKANTLFTLPNHQQLTTDRFQLLSTLGELWTKGVPINLNALGETKKRQCIPLPTYPFQKQRYWVEPDQRSIVTNDAGALYKPVWSYEAIEHHPPSHLNEFNYILFKDKTGIGEQIAEILIKQGIKPIVIEQGQEFKQLSPTHFTINVSEPSHYTQLMSSLKDTLHHPIILHCFSYDDVQEEFLDTAQIEHRLHLGFYSLLYMTQSLLSELGTTIPIHVALITSGTQRIVGTENICPINASLLGSSRVIPLEHHNISCEFIDINTKDNVALILNDLLNSSGQKQKEKSHKVTAYRNGYRWELSYAPFQSKTPSNRFSDHGIYLITGGLGGIGLALSNAIARHAVSPTLILCSRKAIPPQSDWSDIAADPAHPYHTKIEQLHQLKELGANIECFQADIGNYEEVVDVVTFCKNNFGRINGVIHAAGIAGGGLIQLKTKEAVHQVLVSKIHGTYHLAKALQEFNLDFVVLMSSIASITGEQGQMDYCAANACLDSFAQSHLFHTSCLLNINWNTWREVGMSVETNRPEDMSLFSRGNTISPTQGQELFLKALASRCSNLVTSNYSVEEYDQLIRDNKPIIDEEHKVSRDTFHMNQEFKAPKGPIEKQLATLWQENLHIVAIGREDDFFALGGHSLKALTLIEHINTTLGTHLSIQHLYQAPTIAQLAEVIGADRAQSEIDIVVPLKKLNSKQYPFFFCHPASGMIYCFNDFLAQWDYPISVYGLQDPSIASGALLFDSISSMAYAYMNAIKKIQPHGPYFLVGYSLGGTLMHEVAHLLKKHNEPIGLLAMIDSWCTFSAQQQSKDHFIEAYLSKELKANKDLADLAWDRMNLLMHHKPSNIQQDMVLFKASELNKDYLEINDSLNGWEQYNSGTIICHTIKANHDTIIREGCTFIVQKLIKYRDIGEHTNTLFDT
ncbi:type I polyketide synthase [Legionella fallonii]|uniref:Polyketide synthase module n=1 Tax=Legionella fallonii LLAP-10 TaxID=1212491 RepID=A0A098G7E3_9GAMM|nr:type I polyketide synthase [Legionella fallonii]CEG58377.1 Polyketide synthase module [Legionella fallonii LLAP-10]